MHTPTLTAVIGDNSILLSLSEDQRPAIMSLQKRKLGRSPLPLALTQTDSGRKLEKLSSVDPKVSHSQVEVSSRIISSVAR